MSAGVIWQHAHHLSGSSGRVASQLEADYVKDTAGTKRGIGRFWSAYSWIAPVRMRYRVSFVTALPMCGGQFMKIGPVGFEVSAVSGFPALASAEKAGQESPVDFSKVLANALEAVDGAQVEAEKLAVRFQSGEADASLEGAMIAMQKANISFQAIVQVRNRVISAYHDIMNMQV